MLLSKKPRLTVRISNTRISAQIIEFDPKGDVVKCGVDSSGLSKLGWKYSLKNYPAAYLTGIMLAKKAIEKGVSGDIILDTGFALPMKKGKFYALLKGAVDAGLTVKFGNESIFPEEDKISGKAIADYAGSLESADKEAYKSRFSECIKNGADPKQIVKGFEAVKSKLAA